MLMSSEMYPRTKVRKGIFIGVCAHLEVNLAVRGAGIGTLRF